MSSLIENSIGTKVKVTQIGRCSNKIAHGMGSLVNFDAIAHKVAGKDNESYDTHPN